MIEINELRQSARQSAAGLGFLPVNAFDPLAQILSDVHGEGVIVELVHLLQVLAVQHLKLAPLRHLLENKKPSQPN